MLIENGHNPRNIYLVDALTWLTGRQRLYDTDGGDDL